MDTRWKIYDTVLAWIQAADTKAGYIIAIAGMISAIGLSGLEQIQKMIDIPSVVLFLVVACSCVVTSVVTALGVVKPKIDSKTKSLVFFSDICREHDNPADYSLALRDAMNSPSILEDDLANQIRINAEICDQKHRRLKFSSVFLVIGIVSLQIACVLFLFHNG